ncbi:hypothetical protein D9M68_648160 [compost metagenome]
MEKDSITGILIQMVALQEKILEQLQNRPVPSYSVKNADEFLNDLIDRVDVKAQLQISDSTLFRISKHNLVNTIRIGKRVYYSKKEIQQIARYFMK